MKSFAAGRSSAVAHRSIADKPSERHERCRDATLNCRLEWGGDFLVLANVTLAFVAGNGKRRLSTVSWLLRNLRPEHPLSSLPRPVRGTFDLRLSLHALPLTGLYTFFPLFTNSFHLKRNRADHMPTRLQPSSLATSRTGRTSSRHRGRRRRQGDGLGDDASRRGDLMSKLNVREQCVVVETVGGFGRETLSDPHFGAAARGTSPSWSMADHRPR